ncbi:MAG: hypothetical protein ACTSRZ_01865 [Promethearchaeota archaeon]
MKIEDFDFEEALSILQKTHTSLCLNPFELYEGIVIIKWPKLVKFNSASMGIRFLDEYTLVITPYPTTDTYSIFKQSCNVKNKEDRLKFTVNFTDNILYYALSTLYSEDKGHYIEEINQDDLIIDYELGIAYLKDSKISLLCELLGEFKFGPIDASDYLKSYENPNIKKKFNAGFEINILKKYKSKFISKPLNRGDYLALEALILTSKLPSFISQEKKFFDLIEKIRFYQKEIRRFSANKTAFKVCNMIDNYINSLFI